jgi:phage host-nuclease inhibitor protein Gam
MLTEMEEAPDVLPATKDEVTEWVKGAPVRDVEVQAAWWLRRLAEVQAEVEAIDARRDGEVARIEAHYARQRAPLTALALQLEMTCEAVAEVLTYPKGKKSVSFTYGVIGKRENPESIKIVDAAAAVAFAKAEKIADAIKTEEKPVHKVLAPVVLALRAGGKPVPAGFEYAAAADVPYVKPNSAAASGVA